MKLAVFINKFACLLLSHYFNLALKFTYDIQHHLIYSISFALYLLSFSRGRCTMFCIRERARFGEYRRAIAVAVT